VPLADPRIVRFAFQSGFSLKFRAGASKWILRRAVSDILPEEVINRRKVGFDTPAEAWMRGPHRGFVRELLLSSRARGRGWWQTGALEAIVDHQRHPRWFDIVWKALCIESWATLFLDQRLDIDLPTTRQSFSTLQQK
jgi:asparagine synthase (glutamine-hydrolysing)